MKSRWVVGVLISLVLSGCNKEPTVPVYRESDTDTDTDTDADTDADADTDSDADADADADGDCADDASEPELDPDTNPEEDFSDATGQVSDGTSDALMLTPDSPQDFWRFAIGSGVSKRISLEFLHAEGDINLEIYRRDGSDPDYDYVLVGTADSTDDNEEVVIASDSTNAHYFKVLRASPGCQTYTYTVETL